MDFDSGEFKKTRMPMGMAPIEAIPMIRGLAKDRKARFLKITTCPPTKIRLISPFPISAANFALTFTVFPVSLLNQFNSREHPSISLHRLLRRREREREALLLFFVVFIIILIPKSANSAKNLIVFAPILSDYISSSIILDPHISRSLSIS